MAAVRPHAPMSNSNRVHLGHVQSRPNRSVCQAWKLRANALIVVVLSQPTRKVGRAPHTLGACVPQSRCPSSRLSRGRLRHRPSLSCCRHKCLARRDHRAFPAIRAVVQRHAAESADLRWLWRLRWWRLRRPSLCDALTALRQGCWYRLSRRGRSVHII